jgi:hypothetical protein
MSNNWVRLRCNVRLKETEGRGFGEYLLSEVKNV